MLDHYDRKMEVEVIDGGGQEDALLTDLFKAFDWPWIVISKSLCLRFWWKFLVICSIYKRALKLVYQDSHDVKFHELLGKGKSVSVHQKIFQLLATEIFKSKTGVSPELMNDTFHFVERPYNLRSDYTLERKRDHTVYHGAEILSSFAPRLWDLLPNSTKNSASLKESKKKINTWAFDCCPCRISKEYVGRVQFI